MVEVQNVGEVKLSNEIKGSDYKHLSQLVFLEIVEENFEHGSVLQQASLYKVETCAVFD